jgi:hypothetical protein
MSRRLDPENVTDADREYFSQFPRGEEVLTSATAEADAEKQRKAFLEAQAKEREAQAKVNDEEAKKAEAVLDAPASTGVPKGQVPEGVRPGIASVTPVAAPAKDTKTSK